jgi:hypothetical protein
LELCPAAAEPEVAAVVAGAPTQPFSCTPFDADGNASAVSPSGGAGHVGLVVRATGATAPRVRALELHYTAVDQFFVVFPPHGDATRMTVRLTPERARIVAAQAFLFPDRRSNGAPAVSLRQGARRLRRTTPVVSLDADCYGPAKLHRSVVVRVAKVPRADETVGLVLQWA